MILTKELLQVCHSCTEGYKYAIENNLLGMDYDEVISFCIANNKQDFALWLKEQKNISIKSEDFVRLTGEIMTMGAYQVFNPLTGQHTRYETEAETKAALVEIAKEVLNQHCPKVVQELSNENGDTTWIATNLNEALQVSV